MGELLAACFEIIPVLGLDGILNSAGNWVIGAQDGALGKFDFARGIALEPTTCSSSAARLLTLSPCLCRARLTPAVWRSNSGRHVVARLLLLSVALVVAGAIASVVCVRLAEAVCGGWSYFGSPHAIWVLSGVLVAKRAFPSARGVSME